MATIRWKATEGFRKVTGVDPAFSRRVLLWDREYEEAVFGSLDQDKEDGKFWLLDDEQKIDYEDISHWAELPERPVKYAVVMAVDGEEYLYGKYDDEDVANMIAKQVHDERDVDVYVDEVEI